MATRKRPAKAVTPVATPDDAVGQAVVVNRGGALVFISHDSRDADFAEAFANLLADVSGGTLKSFRSSDKKSGSGIEFGTEWYKEIMSQLGDATDVVALLTQRSVDRPWILYEAGVAKGKLNTNVLGVALGVALEVVSTGPFGQFQNCGDDEDSLTKLVMQLLQKNPDAAPREEAIRMHVQLFMKKVKELSPSKGKTQTATVSEETNVAKLFEEVKVMVRELPQRIEARGGPYAKSSRLRRTRGFHPMFVEELLFHPAFRKSSTTRAHAWLMFISLVRDDMPWLFEVGLDFYKALRGGDSRQIRLAQVELINLLETVSDGPLFHEFMGPENEEAFYLLRHLPKVIVQFSKRSQQRTIASQPDVFDEQKPV
ncbi:MAG: toll/interleukin-1 receptor domain-containing protein [Moraxellaceae bacterium]|nr:toll/interleukin-1 receptor domain-containing protein [Moraxellaceae bacterium]